MPFCRNHTTNNAEKETGSLISKRTRTHSFPQIFFFKSIPVSNVQLLITTCNNSTTNPTIKIKSSSLNKSTHHQPTSTSHTRTGYPQTAYIPHPLPRIPYKTSDIESYMEHHYGTQRTMLIYICPYTDKGAEGELGGAGDPLLGGRGVRAERLRGGCPAGR